MMSLHCAINSNTVKYMYILSLCRLHQIKSAVMAVSVLAHLICPPYLLLPPTSSVLTSLTSLLTHCIGAATAAACSVAGLKSDRKTPTVGGGIASSAGGGEGGGKAETAATPAASIAELLSLISYCQTPAPANVVTARALAHDISTLTVRYTMYICTCTCTCV